MAAQPLWYISALFRTKKGRPGFPERPESRGRAQASLAADEIAIPNLAPWISCLGLHSLVCFLVAASPECHIACGSFSFPSIGAKTQSNWYYSSQ